MINASLVPQPAIKTKKKSKRTGRGHTRVYKVSETRSKVLPLRSGEKTNGEGKYTFEGLAELLGVLRWRRNGNRNLERRHG